VRAALLKKIEQKEFVVGVIGLGYVGLPLLFTFAENGYRVVGFDVDEKKIHDLDQGQSYIRHIPSRRVREVLASGRLSVTSDFSRLPDCDGILIAVPTPLTLHREPDMRYVVQTVETIRQHLRQGQLIILESTTYPGTTEELLIPALEESGLVHGKDFLAAYSPEREDPNNKEFTTGRIPKVVGGASPDGLAVATALYERIVSRVVPVSSPRVAEAAKLMENIFRAVNVALVNELKLAFMEMGIDVWEVIEAASTKPFGYMPFYPGPGLGGHCIPIDPFYLTWKAREYGVTTRFIELAGEINTAMPDFVVGRVMEALSDQGKPLKGSRILLLGLAYKANVDDARESPTFHLMGKLEDKGAGTHYNDPYIPVIGPSRQFSRFEGRQSVEISADFDLILIATAHDAYRKVDFKALGVPVVDTRNILKGDSPLFYKG